MIERRVNQGDADEIIHEFGGFEPVWVVGSGNEYEPYIIHFGEGLTLRTGDTYLGDCQSVDWAEVWNPSTEQPMQVTLGQDGYYWKGNQAVVDARPEIVAKWDAWKKAQEMERLHQVALYEDRDRTERIEADKKRPSKGKTVRVVAGRKIPIGTVAQVFWLGSTKFGESVGIEVADELAGKVRVFTASKNVEVV